MPEIKARVTHKHDTEANWNKAINFIPLKGELIIYDSDATHSCPRVKVGDGAETVINLPFITDLSISLDELQNEIANQDAAVLAEAQKSIAAE